MKERKEKYYGFVHGYLANLNRKDKFGDPFPDNSTRACLYAAAKLIKSGDVDSIALSIESELAGPNVRRLRALLPNKLKENKEHPEDDKIYSSENTVTTLGEIREVIKILKKDPTCTVISVCVGSHEDRIKKIMEVCTFLRPDVSNRWHILSFEKIMEKAIETGDHEIFHKEVLEGSKNWEDLNGFRKQEEKVAKFLNIPVAGPLGISILPELIPDKVKIKF